MVNTGGSMDRSRGNPSSSSKQSQVYLGNLLKDINGIQLFGYIWSCFPDCCRVYFKPGVRGYVFLEFSTKQQANAALECKDLWLGSYHLIMNHVLHSHVETYDVIHRPPSNVESQNNQVLNNHVDNHTPSLQNQCITQDGEHGRFSEQEQEIRQGTLFRINCSNKSCRCWRKQKVELNWLNLI